jgi:hypothetical protein
MIATRPMLSLGPLLRLDQPPFQAVQVGQHQLGFHHLDIA